MDRYGLIRNVRLADQTSARTDGCDIFFVRRADKSEILSIGKNLRTGEIEGMKIVNAHGMQACAPLFDMRCTIPDELRAPYPGLASSGREDFRSGLSAACAGGFGGILLTPLTHPAPDSPSLVRLIKKRTQESGACAVFPTVPLTRGGKGQTLCNFEELQNAGAAAVCADFEEKEVGASMMLEALKTCRALSLTFIAPCAKGSMKKGAVNSGRMAAYFGVGGIDPLGELLALTEALALARFSGCPLHFPLVTLEKSVEMIRNAKKEGVPVSCGTAPYYFMFSEDELLFSGSNAKLLPPLRSEKDRCAVIEGLKDGTIDCICSDHTPRSETEKKKDLSEALPGAAGLETAFAAGITGLVLPGHLSLYELLSLMSAGPAGLIGRGAAVRVGNPMDLMFFDVGEELVYEKNTLRSRGSNTPFYGRALQGRVTSLYLDGVKQF